MQPLEPVNPEEGCGVVWISDEEKVWRCAQTDCDGEHHYFRRILWIGPFYDRDDTSQPDLDESA